MSERAPAAPRRMPEPWFQGETLNKPISEMRDRGRRRALRPGERALGAFVLPPFQRQPVWTVTQQILLVESLWDGLPVNEYVYNHVSSPDHPCDGWLLDGQQRVTAILAYLDDAFPVKGWRYSEITEADRRGFEMKPVTCRRTSSTSVEQCRTIYDRLCYGGTPHAPAVRPL